MRNLSLLMVSLLVTAGCAEDEAPDGPSPPRAPEVPVRDASFADGKGGELDASVDEASHDAGAPPVTARALPDAGAGCRTLVSDSLIEHACFHARGGPYRDVSAGAEAIDVSRAHTAFRVALTPDPSGGFAATLAYRARTTGAYALFASPGARLARVDPAAPQPFSAHPTELCPALPQVAVHALTTGVHELRVSSDQPSATVVIEPLDEGGFEDAYRVVCDAPRPGATGVSALDAGTDASPATAGIAAPPTASQTDTRSQTGASAETAPSMPRHRDDVGVIAPTPSLPAESPSAVAEAARDVPSTTPPAPISAPPPCRVDPVLEHACLHVRHGPFAEVDARAGAAVVPSISAPHTVYVLGLGAAAGRVAYRPVLQGQHVFYLEADLPLTLHAPDGRLTATHVEPVVDCAGLTRAHVFNLTAGTRYEAEIGPGRATAQVLVESVDSLTFDGWDARFEPCT